MKSRIDKIFAERAMAQVEKAIDETVHNCFERDYQRVTAWGSRKVSRPAFAKSWSEL